MCRCMSACPGMDMSKSGSIHIHICPCLGVCLYISMATVYICLCIYVYVSVYIHLHIFLCVYLSICVWICIGYKYPEHFESVQFYSLALDVTSCIFSLRDFIINNYKLKVSSSWTNIFYSLKVKARIKEASN